MNSGKFVFPQVMEYFPRWVFNDAVAEYNGDYRMRMSCFTQCQHLLFGQLAGCKSLNEIELILKAHAKSLYHLGFDCTVDSSSLSRANETRDYRIYEKLGQWLIKKVRPMYAKEHLSNKDSARTEGQVFSGNIEQTLTRTVITPEFKVNWETGDQIDINGAVYSAVPSDPATFATFQKISGEEPEATFKAVFPASLNTADGLAFPATQVYSPGKFNSPMYAESDNNLLSFNNICGVLCLSLNGADKVKSIAITANEALCGAFSMTDASTVNLTGTGKTVTLDCGEGIQLDPETATKFYIYLPPKTYSPGMKIAVQSTDNTFFRKTTTANAEILRSNLYTFNWNAAFNPNICIYYAGVSGTVDEKTGYGIAW